MKKSLLLSAALMFGGIVSAQWVEQSTGFAELSRGVESIRIVDANTVWAIGYDGGSTTPANVQEFTLTTDGGTTWTSGAIALPDPLYNVNEICPINATTAYVGVVYDPSGAGPYPSGVWKTTDSGANWTQEPIAGFTDPSSFMDAMHFFNASTGIAVGDPITTTDFEVYRTTDGGANWNLVPAASLPNILSGEMGYNGGNVAAGNSFWFVTNKGKLYRTNDMGATWSKLNTPISDFSATAVGGSIHFADSNNGILLARATTGTGTSAVSTYKLYKTTNGGLTWDAGVAYTQPYINFLAFIPGSTTLVGSGVVVGTPNVYSTAYSTDFGTTWTTIDSGTQRTGVAFANGATGWAGGFTTATGGGIYKYTGPALGTSVFNTTKNQIVASPNPTNGMLKLIAASSTISDVTVFDLLGKQVLAVKYNALNEVNVDLSNLQTGAYLLKATNAAGSTDTIKIMKN